MTKCFRLDSTKVLGCLAAFLAFSFSAKGQDLEPRTYANTPVGLNFLIAGYGYTAGGVATDPALPIENTQVELHSGVLAYARDRCLWQIG